MCLLILWTWFRYGFLPQETEGVFFPDSNKPRVVEHAQKICSICIHYTQYTFIEYMYSQNMCIYTYIYIYIYLYTYIFTQCTLNIKFSSYCNIYIHTS